MINEGYYSVYSEFNLDKHMETYADYLEAIMFRDGHIEYAVPSHQEKLIKIAASKAGMSKEDFLNQVPDDAKLDFLNYLLNYTGCISLWSSGFIIPTTTITNLQVYSLLELINLRLTMPRILSLFL